MSPRKEPTLEPARLRLALTAGLALALAALPRPAAAQDVAPRLEDAELPGAGNARLRVQPVLQAWHREFGPGPEEGRKVPLRNDFDGPLLDHVHPGREPLVAGLNDDASALGFNPLAPGDASLGTLDVRELAANVRGVLAELEVGVFDRLAVNAAVPLVRTEVEPFSAYDPAGANLAPATTAMQGAFAFLNQVQGARQQLQQQVDGGQLSPSEEQQAQALLQASGAFATALDARLTANALVPLAGTSAGDQLLAHLGGIRSGFADFGLSIPELGLGAELTAGGLSGFVDLPLDESTRGWLAGETELGLRFLALDGFARTPAGRSGLELRTAVGVRLRLPFRSPNAAAFVQPFDVLGVPLGDGQRDLELSLYQDVRVAGSVLLNAILRYGIQRPDRLLQRTTGPDRPFSTAVARTMERDLGDYVQARLAPRLTLNPFLTVGAEYRYWHKGSDSYRVVDGSGADASALEAQTAQTRHRLGIGTFYRPDPPEEGERRGAVPELGFVWQTALSGSGGETPAAGLTTMYVRIPFRLF